MASARLSSKPRRRLVLRYAATASATVQLDVLKGRHRVARVKGRARAGANTIRLRVPRKAGRYTLRLTLTTADGQHTVQKARLTVRR
ncbi:MAG TPA: hypothetical protein VGF25_16435 [Thermoleophilaceae bacterium]|jgi:hypothetical protein